MGIEDYASYVDNPRTCWSPAGLEILQVLASSPALPGRDFVEAFASFFELSVSIYRQVFVSPKRRAQVYIFHTFF